MYHLPPDANWNADTLALECSKSGLNAHVEGNAVITILAIEEFPDLDLVRTAKSVEEISLKVVGETKAIVSHKPNCALENVSVDYPRLDFCSTIKTVNTTMLRNALSNCGIISGDLRSIVLRYMQGNKEIESLLIKFEELKQQKESEVSNHKFDLASATLEKQRKIRQQMECRVATAMFSEE